MCAHERSTEFTHKENPNQRQYDWAYYNSLMPHITGNVLDIGSGAGLFVREYAKRKEVESVVCLDKYTDETFYPTEKTTRTEWVCPQELPEAKVNTVVSTEFIEHIERDQLEPLLKQISDRLTDDGVFVGSTPNKKYPTTNPYHIYEYTLDELTEILKQYFPKVKAWDCGNDCTVFVCKKSA